MNQKPKMQSRSSGKAIASFVLGLSSFFCACFTGIAAVILGIFALADISKSQGRLQGNGLAIAGIVLGSIGCFWTLIMIALLLPAVQQVREAARRATSMNSIRQMTLSMHNYHAAYGRLPIADVSKGQGLSWRVHILPFVDEAELYEQFHLDEPWNSPHNLTLVNRMPAIFSNPSMMVEPGKTTYLVPTTPAGADPQLPHAAFVQGSPGPTFGEFPDGLGNTILILEADSDAAVTWTDPNGDWMFDPNDPTRSLGNVRPGKIVIGLADGGCRMISNQTTPQDLKAMITRDGGEIVRFD